jgi:hypothetical protein
VEVTVAGVDAASVSDAVAGIVGAVTIATPGGARITVLNERDVDRALAVIRALEGRLVSVQPVKQSLEELFVRETEANQA